MAQSIGISGLDARQGVGGLVHPSTGNTWGNTSGVFPGGTSGAGPSNDLLVLAPGGMAVTINAGQYAIFRGANGVYLGAVTATVTLTHGASSPSNPRIDYIVLRVRDPGVDSGVTQSAQLLILAGSPASVPSGPDAFLTDGDMVLAAVTVRTATTAITPTDVSDRRVFITSRGGITPRQANDNRAGAYEGQYRDNTASKNLERWSGTTWEPVAAPSEWIQWTPRLMCDGTGTDIGLGSGSKRIGRFQLVGKRLDFLYWFEWGAPPWNGGTGDIFTRLPLHPVTGQTMVGVGYSQWVQCHLWTENSAYTGDFAGQALLHANSNRITPFFPRCHGHYPPDFPVDMNTDPYRIATTQGAAGTGVPRLFLPLGFPEGGDLGVMGHAEIRLL